MSLEEFCDACKIPFWGSLDEPPTSNYVMLLASPCNGEDRGVSQARIKVFISPLFVTLHFLMGNAFLVNKIVVHFVPPT
jgi:hypothetical protein